MPRRFASSNSGLVSGPGIARSKYLSISAWLSMYQRGKKVVSASSGKTMSVAPASAALRIRTSSRSTASFRVCSKRIGPSWPPATRKIRDMACDFLS